MGVFLRWGVFGILTVAALMYAFHANQRLAKERGAADQASGVCEAELQVARRALEAADEGRPLDEVLDELRVDPDDDEERRERLESVAEHWYSYDGDEMDPADLRRTVRVACRKFIRES